MRTRDLGARMGLVAVLGLLLVSVASVANADSYIVTKRVDDNGTCYEGNCSLREAILAANSNPGADYIILPSGTFTLTIAGADDLGGDLDIRDTAWIQGQGSSNSIIDSSGVGERAMHIIGNITVGIASLAINGGYTNKSGCGIANEGGTVSVNNVAVTNNHAIGNGGGIYTAGDLDVTDSVISGNLADGDGGGIVCFSGTLTLTDSSVADNEAYGVGGGIYSTSPSNTLANVVVRDNEAQGGGGIYVYQGGIVVEGGSRVVNNHAVGSSSVGGGGGIYVLEGNIVVEGGSWVVNNQAVGGSWSEGGGIKVYSSTLTVTDSTVSGNSAGEDGGGLLIHDTGATITGSTISGNTAGNRGGGLTAAHLNTVEISNSTVHGNSASIGGGFWLHLNANLLLHSVTIGGNDATSASALYCQDCFLEYTNTLISGTETPNSCWYDDALSLFVHAGNLESPGNTCSFFLPGCQNSVADPGLSQLGDFGGLTHTQLLLPGSPAVNTGAHDDCLAEDQRGELRSDGLCDIGAVERQPGDPYPIFLDGFASGDTSAWSGVAR